MGYIRGVESQYLLDTCSGLSVSYQNSNGYCAVLIIQKSYNRKGVITDMFKTTKYFELNPNEKTRMYLVKQLRAIKL